MDMTNETKPAEAKTPACKKTFWLYALLFVSLTFNVFMAGIVFGRAGTPLAAVRAERLAEAAKSFRSLSPETRDKVKTAVKDEWPEVKDMLGDIRTKRAAVRSILEQPEYDRAALEKAFADLYKSVDALQLQGQKVILKVADTMTPEERVTLLKSLPKPGL